MIRTELITSVAALVKRHALSKADKIAYEDKSSSVTYAELAIQTARLASWLQIQGHMPGSRVAILVPSSVDWIVACFAILRAGCVAVPISSEATEPEVRYRLEDAACRSVFVWPAYLPMVRALKAGLPGLDHIIVASDAEHINETAGEATLLSILAMDQTEAPRDLDDIDEVAFIVYTSGTTGRAKGVALTQRSMLWVSAACWAPIARLDENDVVLSPLPLFHSYALNFSVLTVLTVGATEMLLERYSTQEVWAQLQTGRFTVMPGVPTMFHYLLEKHRGKPPQPIPGLRLCVSAGAILPAALNREFEAQFNVPLLDGYGITETSTMVTMNWPNSPRVMGSCGLPLPGVAVRIVSPLDDRDMPSGDEGELIVRGPNIMQGYINKPDETASVLRNGWYHTGDLARCDANGFLTITGRLKELIIRGGQNIAPAEIEEALLEHPSVGDCAVIGMAHAHLGEVPVACVVLRVGHSVDSEALRTHVAQILSAYKVPSVVHLVEAIPRTGSGKIMRFKLRDALTEFSAAAPVDIAVPDNALVASTAPSVSKA